MENPVTPDMSSFKLRDEVLDLSTPRIMGILNVTPDSFSDGGRFNSLKPALEQIELMISRGAAIIDVGGESTRPGSDPVSQSAELERIVPVLEKAIPAFHKRFFLLIPRNVPWRKRPSNSAFIS